jgi:hypothetical protein
MTRMSFLLTLAIVVVLAVWGGRTITAQDTADDKYTVQVPGGLAFSEFRGYERWQVVSRSAPFGSRANALLKLLLR